MSTLSTVQIEGRFSISFRFLILISSECDSASLIYRICGYTRHSAGYSIKTTLSEAGLLEYNLFLLRFTSNHIKFLKEIKRKIWSNKYRKSITKQLAAMKCSRLLIEKPQ